MFEPLKVALHLRHPVDVGVEGSQFGFQVSDAVRLFIALLDQRFHSLLELVQVGAIALMLLIKPGDHLG